MDRLRCGVWLVALVALAGCSSSSGSKFSLSHDGNCLSHAARKLRDTTCPPDTARELCKQPAEPYIVEPGDVLLVQPASLDSPVRLPGDQIVLPDGTIQLGRFGRLCVAGQTVEHIEAEVNQRIGQLCPGAGLISVRLVTRDSKVFYVLGEVNAPGAFPLRGRETVLDAIVIAGGLNCNANRKGILLSRPTAPCSCRVVLPVEYNDIVQLGDTTTNYQIRAGDRVFVPNKCLWDDLAHCFKRKKKPWRTPPVACPPCEVCAGDGGCVTGAVEAVQPAGKAVPAATPVPPPGVPGKLPAVGFPGAKPSLRQIDP